MGLLGHFQRPGGLFHRVAAETYELAAGPQLLRRVVAALGWGWSMASSAS
jgi:hypothetical protein